MLIEIDGRWIDVSKVVYVSGSDGKSCHIEFDRGGAIVIQKPAKEIAAMVNEAKAKAKVYAYVGESAAADLKATLVPYHQGQQDGLRAAQLQLNAALAGTRPEDALDHIRMWLKERIGDHPHKLFSDRQAFTPKQMLQGKWKSRLVALQDIASMMETIDQYPLPGPWSGLVGWLQKEINVAERKGGDPEPETVDTDEAVAQFVADMKSGAGPLMAPAQVSPNAQAFLTPKGVATIGNRARLVALYDVASMMKSAPNGHTITLRDLDDWLIQEIKAVEQKQTETEQDQPEVQKPGGNSKGESDLGSLANPENAYPPGGKCETCKGSGRLDLPFDDSGAECYRCGGSGVQPLRKPAPPKGRVQKESEPPPEAGAQMCHACNGTGEVEGEIQGGPPGPMACEACNGKGTVAQ